MEESLFNIRREFCTENGEIVDLAASGSTNVKVEGIVCYGCNLLVLAEGQVALTPGNNITDDQNSLENTAVGTSSRTLFVMGRHMLGTLFFVEWTPGLWVLCVCVCYTWYFAKVLSRYFDCLVGYTVIIFVPSSSTGEAYRAHTSSRGGDTPDRPMSPTIHSNY